MGLHRPGIKRGLSRRQSAAMQDRWDREDADRELIELKATLVGKDEQIELLKDLITKGKK